jgi:enediyne biosynthesis protein E11
VSQANPITALTDECDSLDEHLTVLADEQWQLPTPAPGWTIAHQVAHLAATFRLAGLAASDGAAFNSLVAGLSSDFGANVRNAMAGYLADPPAVLLRRWQAERATAVAALADHPADAPVPWLVNPLPPSVLATAGMMEAFAHGQDVADALGYRPERTDRIRFVTEFVVRTWEFGYQARGELPPSVAFRYELTGPSGDCWTFGPEAAEQRITGSAVDLCLLATRRRHPADLDIRACGPDAEHWVEIAQCYRGPAGAGRAPEQFSSVHQGG